MASREKRPLVPSKSKQKANNDSGLPSNEIRNRKAKALSNLKNQQLTRDILEAVATGSQLPPKLEATLPRKRVLRNLKRKQKLRVAKANLIKGKVTRRVNNKNLCRITTDIKRGLRTKRLRLTEGEPSKKAETTSKTPDNAESEGESTSQESPSRVKLRPKKTKATIKTEEDNEEVQDTQDTDPAGGPSNKLSPRFARRGRYSGSPESTGRAGKAATFSGFRSNSIGQSGNYSRGAQSKRGRKPLNRQTDCLNNSKGPIDAKLPKQLLDSKTSIDLTIDEVIASMLSDSEIENQQGATEKIGGKITRSKKMLVDETIAAAIEIKKEPDSEDTKVSSDSECMDVDQGSQQNVTQSRRRSTVATTQRSLRNGKLRQLSDSGLATDADIKKHRRLYSEEPVTSETSLDQTSDCNAEVESCISESSGNDSQADLATAKDEACTAKQDGIKTCEESTQVDIEVKNNNNSERIDRTSEIGPTLRSKTKAKTTEGEVKSDDSRMDCVRIGAKCTEAPEEQRKAGTLDQIRKDTILAKFTDKSKAIRSTLNIDMKKTVSSFYGTDKSDSNPKSQIDQMIETIKLTIAKSIESKIFGPEKGLGLNKNFDVPKTEEIIAPLSAESQKLGLEENVDEDKSNTSKNEIKSDSTENAVPKVADTAKEIEKLVMGDIELAETHSQNVQESESSDRDGINNVHNVGEAVQATENVESNNNVVEQEEGTTSDESGKATEEINDSHSKSPDDVKRAVSIRKSPRISDKSSSESGSPELVKKVCRIANKSPKSDNLEDLSPDCGKVSIPNEAPAISESPKEEDPVKILEEVTETRSELTEGIVNETQEQVEISPDKESMNNITADLEISLPVSDHSEESETLESISQEVERLVAGDQTIVLETDSQDNQMSKEEISSEPAIETQEVDEAEDLCDPEKDSTISSKDTVEPVTDTSDPANTSNMENQSQEANNTEEDNSRNIEAEQCTKTDKHNNENLATEPLESLCESEPTNCSELNVLLEESEKSTKDELKKDKQTTDDTAKEVCEVSEAVECEAATKSPESIQPISQEDSEKSCYGKNSEEQKSTGEEKRRVLRARDKSKKSEKRQTSCSRERTDMTTKVKGEEDQKPQTNADTPLNSISEDKSEVSNNDEAEDAQNNTNLEQPDVMEPLGRTRRSREVKKRKEEQLPNTLKTKRSKRDIRKSDQQNKEETLLDNEVAKINENNRSYLNKFRNGNECGENFRGFSEGGREGSKNIVEGTENVRSKSENDLVMSSEIKTTGCEGRLSRNLSENHMSKETENIDILDGESKSVKTPEILQKDSDETSTSGESSSSANITPKILETPEDKAKKESILRLLGLESLEKAAERLNHQKARKEQYTGTLKTVIRVQKEKDKDKRLSRSPLKMVLKQGRGDGDGDSPEFYTIQKELGTSGLGDSSSGANRKFTTNHRYSCEEDNEDAVPKDRQSLVIPEKSSSFSIHPGRLCADVCCYCFGKFGSLDTPMHLAQMKSDERRKKILSIERHLTKDSCLCDACYRHVDRKANTSPTNMQAKPQKQHRQLMVSKCTARDCRDPARHHVKRRWLLKIKAGLQNQVDIDWDASQHTSLSFCVKHYSKIERFLTCALCTRRLARNHTHQLSVGEIDELNHLLSQQNIPVLLTAGTFVCKLCRYFTQLQRKYKDLENMSANHRSFFKSYRKRILHYHDIEVLENEDEDSSQNQSKDKDKRKKTTKGLPPKTGTSKSPDAALNSASEKSTPEPTKNEGSNAEMEGENRVTKSNAPEENVPTDVQYLGIESAVEKLKKRKMLDMHAYPTETIISSDGSSEVVEILAMDKEVTLTRLPKRPRTSNDISPVVQRLGANPSISVRTLFPGEEEMNLHANVEFTNVREVTPQGWEKCATMIQYDRDTKLLWQELQRPYGNQSSFLRHLILLEKYYRSGDLVLAPNASRNAINYSTSVQNRLISYEGPEKMDEPIMEPIASEYSNSRRLSGGFVVERDRQSLPSTSSTKPSTATISSTKGSPPRVLKLSPGVSIIKKPPPNLQRLNIPSTSASNGSVKRKEGPKVLASCGAKMIQLSDAEVKRLQLLQKQKQMLSEKQPISPGSGSASSNSPPSYKSATQYQKAPIVTQTQFQKHLRRQQEMLNRQSRGDFEPLICDVRSLANENSPTQNLLHNLNLPKSIQVTTKPPNNPIPILPKIPKSLTVIPQTVTRPAEK